MLTPHLYLEIQKWGNIPIFRGIHKWGGGVQFQISETACLNVWQISTRSGEERHQKSSSCTSGHSSGSGTGHHERKKAKERG